MNTSRFDNFQMENRLRISGQYWRCRDTIHLHLENPLSGLNSIRCRSGEFHLDTEAESPPGRIMPMRLTIRHLKFMCSRLFFATQLFARLRASLSTARISNGNLHLNELTRKKKHTNIFLSFSRLPFISFGKFVPFPFLIRSFAFYTFQTEC